MQYSVRRLKQIFRTDRRFKVKKSLSQRLKILLQVLLVLTTAVVLIMYAFYVTNGSGINGAILTISTLDSAADLALDGEGKQAQSHSGLQAMLNHTSNIVGNTIIWETTDFPMYLEGLANYSLGPFQKLRAGKMLDRSGKGFWIFHYDPKNSNDNNAAGLVTTTTHSIWSSQITQHVGNTNGIAPEELEVAIAIRAYVDGEAALKIRYQDSISKQVTLRQIAKDVFRNKGFCHEILDVPFNKRVDTVQIQTVITNYRRRAIVIVDKVIIVVSKRDVSQSIMHTLVPNNWC